MKATIVESSFGVFAFDYENKLIDQMLFPKQPASAAKILAQIEAGKATEGFVEFVRVLQKSGYDKFVFENAAIANDIHRSLGAESEVSKPSEAGEMLRSRSEQFAVETGFVKNSGEFDLWMHNVTMEVAKLRVKGAVEKRDLVVAQAIQTLDDLDKTINLLMSRVREWYGVHFPELDRLLEKHETYARLILKLGNKENFTVAGLRDEEIPQSKAEGIAKTAEKSMGADLSETDLAQVQALCKRVLDLYNLRQSMEIYMDKTMDEVAPNTKSLVGSLLGARLIAISGGLTNLARRPASTIQVLGAEKALFRSLKTGTRPPKHGLIFQHTLLHDAKRWQRGKIARALAGKLAIAVRTDAFGKRDISEFLKTSLNKRIEEIQEKYAEPPQVPEAKSRQERPRDDRNRRKHRRER